MRILQYIFLVMFVSLMIGACDPFAADQIKARAEADAKAAESQQLALNQEQVRQFAQDQHAIDLQNAAREQQRKNAIAVDVIHGWQTFIRFISYVLIGCAAFILFRGTQITIEQYQIAAIGITKALVQAADIRSRLVYLDDGRQFPAILSNNTVTDITTQQVTDTNTPQLGNSQAITGAIANRHVGIVAKETRRAGKNGESVPLSQNPPVIEARFSDVREYLELVTKQKDGKNESV